jgi:hypothetical protein
MDLSILFESLTITQNQFLVPCVRLPNDEIIAITLDVASEEYRPILLIEKIMKGEDLRVEDLNQAKGEEYRHSNLKGSKESKSDEILNSQFTETYYICGKSGNQANKYKRKNEENMKGSRKSKFQGKCNDCGLCGHLSRDLWKNE